MGRSSNFKETASFNSKETLTLTPEGHIRLGDLSAGLFGVCSSSLSQYERIKNKLLKLEGLDLAVYPSHLSSVRLDIQSQNDTLKIQNILRQIKEIGEAAKKDDQEIFYKLGRSIERLTHVRMPNETEKVQQSRLSSAP